jgi:hypothetical protein
MNQQIVNLILGALISADLVVTLFNFFTLRKAKIIEAEVKHTFDVKFEEIRAKIQEQADQVRGMNKLNLDYKEQCLSEVLGPVYMLFERTSLALSRQTPNNQYIEREIYVKTNAAIRDILLSKAHLIPPDLLDDAAKLIDHYDHWIETFIQKRDVEKATDPYIYTHDFPPGSDEKFKDTFHRYRDELKLYKYY